MSSTLTFFSVHLAYGTPVSGLVTLLSGLLTPLSGLMSLSVYCTFVFINNNQLRYQTVHFLSTDGPLGTAMLKESEDIERQICVPIWKIFLIPF